MEKSKKTIHLIDVKTGQILKIISTPHGVLKAQFVRLGIHEGEKVKCYEHLPGGTIVLQKNRQHIAVGHQLARQIIVEVLDGKGH